MIPLAVPNLSGREREYLNRCIDDEFVSSVGEFVTRFEVDVARLAGARHAVAVSSGTTALHAALVDAGVVHDDLVIMPTFTFIASANAVAHCGASPWLLDVESNGLTLSAELLEQALSRFTRRDGAVLRHRDTGRRVAALMPVYALGTLPDMDPILALAAEHGLPVVADGAAALGARYRERELGSLPLASTCISFNGNKTFTCGAGGAILTNDEARFANLKHVTSTARHPERYLHDAVGYNYRMSNLQAAVGCAQLERADEFLGRKQCIAARYQSLAESGRVRAAALPDPDWASHSWWYSGLLLDEDVDPAATLEGLRERDIGVRPFWEPVHGQPPYKSCPVLLDGTAKRMAPRMLILPSSTGMSDADLDRVCTAVAAVLGR